MDAGIYAEGIRKKYKEVEALRGVSLAAPQGTVLGVLGPNGAGKTTMVRILSTLLEPDAGRVSVAGCDVVRQPNEVRKRIGLAGQYAAVDPLLTGRENLELAGRLYHLGRSGARRKADELLQRFGLADAADRPSMTYSGGMRRRLDLAASLIPRPAVIFLDEPTTGLDPASRLALWDMVREQVADGATVLLTTQYLEEAEQLAHRIAVINGGEVIAEGTSDELKQRVGGERLEVTLVDAAGTQYAADLLAQALGQQPTAGEDGRSLSVPLAGAMLEALARAAQVLQDAQIQVTDLAIRRPSLDDVFLTLTGAGAAAPAAATAGAVSAA
ncbi:ATP-binding cassette domain-containing protein [Streptomyces sp. NPDC048483]|uniref:ATP-binding cassette domain-containing protein n=1 Tax=Streptomyces sp. NPDC048483 TaxID=3154927 RepID=UPI00341E60F8